MSCGYCPVPGTGAEGLLCCALRFLFRSVGRGKGRGVMNPPLMPQTDYEYRGLKATTWDLFRGDTSRWDDKFFYLDIIARYGQPVLDVGCGTGRLLLDYLSTGIDIDGVDNSPEMLALCRSKAEALGPAPTLHQQQMESLELPRRYRTIIVPSSSFQLLTDPAGAAEAMERFFEHLQPNGVLVMPFMVLWQEGHPVETDWKLTGEKVRPEDGAVARRWERARFDVERQLEHTEDRFEVVHGDRVVASEEHRRSPATRWYTQVQATALYREAGFTDLEVCREFTHQPASDTDSIFTVLGRRDARAGDTA